MQWPASRLFAKEEFPDNECKNPIRILLLAAQNTSLRRPIVVNVLNMCNDYYDALRKVTKNLLDICPKLVLQRCNHALVQMPTISNSEASHRAWSLLFEDAMPETDLLFSQGKLKNFEGSSRTIEGVNRSIHVTTGRLSSSALIAISGQEELPIISSSSELACLIVLSANKQGGHKMASDTKARTRLIAYIHRPGKLVKSVLESGTLYKLKKEIK